MASCNGFLPEIRRFCDTAFTLSFALLANSLVTLGYYPMKAAVLQEMGRSRPYIESRPLIIEEVALEPPGPGELLLRIKTTGLCHSDLSVINGDHQRPILMFVGHVATSEVLEGI